MIKEINNNKQNFSVLFRNKSNSVVTFKGNPIPTLTHTNIGSCLDGYIGKIRVRTHEGKEAFLNVFKKYLNNNAENYQIKTNNNELIGEVDIMINKKQPTIYDNSSNWADPSHVFVDNLRNYSNPNTPYYQNGLEYFKDIGTRLLQIAQRRSDEAKCCGNIKLISKNESMDWYKNVIKMRQEYPPDGSKIIVHNPNQMYIPPESKEPLSRLQGGL